MIKFIKMDFFYQLSNNHRRLICNTWQFRVRIYHLCKLLWHWFCDIPPLWWVVFHLTYCVTFCGGHRFILLSFRELTLILLLCIWFFFFSNLLIFFLLIFIGDPLCYDCFINILKKELLSFYFFFREGN